VTGTAAATLPTREEASEARMMTASSPEIRLAWTRAEARRVFGMLRATPKEALTDQYWGDDGSRGQQYWTLQR
jgi:hypothetical protein